MPLHFGVSLSGVCTAHVEEIYTERHRMLVARIRQARKDAELTQEEAAEALGVSQNWISKTELGTRRVTFLDVEAFAQLYGKPLEYFATN